MIQERFPKEKKSKVVGLLNNPPRALSARRRLSRPARPATVVPRHPATNSTTDSTHTPEIVVQPRVALLTRSGRMVPRLSTVTPTVSKARNRAPAVTPVHIRASVCIVPPVVRRREGRRWTCYRARVCAVRVRLCVDAEVELRLGFEGLGCRVRETRTHKTRTEAHLAGRRNL